MKIIQNLLLLKTKIFESCKFIEDKQTNEKKKKATNIKINEYLSEKNSNNKSKDNKKNMSNKKIPNNKKDIKIKKKYYSKK